MRVTMGILKNEHGVYYVRKKVPQGLQEATAQVRGKGRERQTFLKKSLGTKDLKEAKRKALLILAQFDRTIEKAKALASVRPLRTTLSEAEIERLANVYYAEVLADDEETRREGTGSESTFQDVSRQLSEAGVRFKTPFRLGSVPEYGLSDREAYKLLEDVATMLPLAEGALARGNIAFVRDELEEVLYAAQINLDRKSNAYRKLGMALLRAHVAALQAIAGRSVGDF